MQNIVLTQTAGAAATVTIYTTEVTEKTAKKISVIPLPTATRGTEATVHKTLIVDLQRITTEFMVRGHINDENRTSLDGSHTSSVTTITVLSTTGFASSGLVKVEQELCSYTGTTATTFTGVTRGIEGTTAVSHNSGAQVWLPAAQYRNQLYTIHDYGGCFPLAYRGDNWSVAFTGLTVTARALDDESPNTFDVEFTATVGEDRIVRAQSSGRVTGRN